MTRQLAVVVAVFSAVGANAVHAQSPAEKTEARAYLADGDRALRKGERHSKRQHAERAATEYEAALSFYEQAYELVPNVKIFFAIGNAEEKLGRYLDAHNHYRQLLEDAENPGAKLVSAVEARIKETLSHLVSIDLTVTPKGAHIFLDSVDVGVAPLEAPLVIEPGMHAIAIRHPGRIPFEKTYGGKPGDRYLEEVDLKPVPKVEDPEVNAIQTRVVDSNRLPGRTWVIGGIGLAASLGAAATVTGVLALSQQATYTDDSVALEEREDARQSGRSLAVTTDILLGSAALVSLATTVYYVSVYLPRSRSHTVVAGETRTTVAPYAGPRGAGLVVTSRF